LSQSSRKRTSFEEIIKVRRRAEWRYQITGEGKPIDDGSFSIDAREADPSDPKIGANFIT
jgi:hypothetical protein